MKKYLVFACLVLLTGCINENQHHDAEEKISVTLNGVDISHHNKVAWNSLKSCNMQFAYVKASEGKTYKDPQRIKNYKKAKGNGLSVGFYTFWRRGISGKDHFENFKAATKGCKPDLPPVLDLEDHVRDKAYQPELMKQAKIFSDLAYKEYGVRPIIYTWYDAAICLHKIDPSYKYWLCVSSRVIRNPHKKVKTNACTKVPWVILQLGRWNFGTGDIDLNYGNMEDEIFQRRK